MMIIALKIPFPMATNFNLEVFLYQRKNWKQNSVLAPALACPPKKKAYLIIRIHDKGLKWCVTE
jgi:hypothetical protein